MTEANIPNPGQFRLSDPVALSRNILKMADRAARIANLMAGRRDAAPLNGQDRPVPLEQLSKTLGTVAQAYVRDPRRFAEAQMRFFRDHTQLWMNAWQRFLGVGGGSEPLAAPERGDRRFADPDWEGNAFFDFLKQSYLITARWARDMVSEADGLDDHTRHKARFYVEQILNALAPTNFVLTNPEVLRATLATNGQNLVDGLDRLEADLKAGGGELRISQTDARAFEVGRNVATTPGKVVFENRVLQLIQYEPTTEVVHEVPLLIVPPWINKYYILDLNTKKSFIRWAVAQGHTIFVVSWVNPGETDADVTLTDYMKEGFFAAVDAVLKQTGQPKANVIGYCVGGTLVAAALAYMAARGDDRVNAVTFLTTQVDFTRAGDLKVFIDEEQLAMLEGTMEKKGYLPGRRMADAFNLLRSNDLIWSYVVNNYMMGKDPPPFDLLFWNSDSTRMPATVHSQYLRECYLHNNLAKGLMALDGERIDLRKVKLPVYNMAAREDHIAPLPSVFKVGDHLGGPVRLVVAGSGHIAGVVNPPDAQKYQYWTNEDGAPTLDEWFGGATEHKGSWWPDWAQWIRERAGQMVKARSPADGPLKPIEDAPGRYVRVRGD